MKTLNECLDTLTDMGLSYTTSQEYDEDEDETKTFYTVEFPVEKTLKAINGKRSAFEINDFLTGITEDERLKHGIDIKNNLYELHKAGKIKMENGVWYLV